MSTFDEEAAASGLLTLKNIDGSTQSDVPDSRAQSVAPITPRKDTDSEVEEDVTPPTSTHTTPVREFKLAGLKRERKDFYTIFYDSGPDRIGVPYAKGDSANTLFLRRDAAARQLFDMHRGQAFCSWRSSMISLVVHGPPWILFRESVQQKRYHHKAIQLIITRYTCIQWRDTTSLCRNCKNRNWRTACLQPTFIMHVLPLPAYRHQFKVCEDSLSDLEATTSDADATSWTQRMPQINVR